MGFRIIYLIQIGRNPVKNQQTCPLSASATLKKYSFTNKDPSFKSPHKQNISILIGIELKMPPSAEILPL